MEEQRRKQSVLMEHVASMEFYQKDNEQPVQVFQDLNFEALEGEIWAIIGNKAFEVRLFLEIVANARPYKDGRCVLNETGMMRKKRLILPHVYYIGSTNMMFENMSVLEYLTFITAKEPGSIDERKHQIAKDLLDVNLGYLSEREISTLTPPEKSVVELMAGYYTESKLIIWNLARLYYDEKCILAIQTICQELQRQKRTLLFSSFDYKMIEACATHISPLYDGRFLCNSPVQDFIKTWDHLCAIIRDDRAKEMEEYLMKTMPDYEYRRNGNRLEVWDQHNNIAGYDAICATLGKNYYYPKFIEQHPYCVENAWKEIVYRYEQNSKTNG